MADGGPDAVLIDGYNVLHAIPRFAPRGSDLIPARERFEAWLAEAAARRRVRECVLVWDGRGDGSRGSPRGPLRVLYTPAGVTADDRIIELCRGLFAARAATTWVVSSDHGIQLPARELGFRVLGAMTFYRAWSAADPSAGSSRASAGEPHDPGASPRPRSSRAEVDELLDAFLEAEPEAE